MNETSNPSSDPKLEPSERVAIAESLFGAVPNTVSYEQAMEERLNSI